MADLKTTKSVALAADDIKVGQHVLIFEPQKFIQGKQTMDNNEVVSIAYDGSFRGMPLKVMAVNLPYILLQAVGLPQKIVCTFDIRAGSLQKVNSQYLKTFKNLMAPEKPASTPTNTQDFLTSFLANYKSKANDSKPSEPSD